MPSAHIRRPVLYKGDAGALATTASKLHYLFYWGMCDFCLLPCRSIHRDWALGVSYSLSEQLLWDYGYFCRECSKCADLARRPSRPYPLVLRASAMVVPGKGQQVAPGPLQKAEIATT